MSSADDPDSPQNASASMIVDIRQVKIPVTDLAISVPWYRTMIGLSLHREFVEQETLAGAVLRHPAGFVISLRMRERVPGRPSFPGFDLVSLGVRSREDLAALSARAQALASEHSGVVDRGADGYHLDVADPDGTRIRFLAPPDTESAVQADLDAERIVGVAFDDAGVPTFYSSPRTAFSRN